MTLDQRGLQARNSSLRNERVRINLLSPAESSVGDLSKRTVLFVDDEPSILTVRRMIFEGRGYSVLTAESGPEALALMQSHLIDVVVLDYLMPEMDGEETALRMRELQADVPILLSTGCTSVPLRVMDIVTMLVHKGSGPQILLDAVERYLPPALQPSAVPSTTLHPES